MLQTIQRPSSSLDRLIFLFLRRSNRHSHLVRPAAPLVMMLLRLMSFQSVHPAEYVSVGVCEGAVRRAIRQKNLHSPREALVALRTGDFWLILDRPPQQRLILRELPLAHKLSLTTGVPGHMSGEIILPCEDILTSVVRLNFLSTWEAGGGMSFHSQVTG